VGVIIGSAKNLRLRISDFKALVFDRSKKGAEFFPLPFCFSTYPGLEKFSYKILADFLGTAQRLTIDHENGNRFCATERN
jgi:hypothetical protein